MASYGIAFRKGGSEAKPGEFPADELRTGVSTDARADSASVS